MVVVISVLVALLFCVIGWRLRLVSLMVVDWRFEPCGSCFAVECFVVGAYGWIWCSVVCLV